MCLGIPGRITEITDAEKFLARVDVSGVRRTVNVACIADEGRMGDLVGKWVLMHVGFAMSVIDEDEAARTLEVLDELGEVQDELTAMRESARP